MRILFRCGQGGDMPNVPHRTAAAPWRSASEFCCSATAFSDGLIKIITESQDFAEPAAEAFPKGLRREL